MHQTLVKYTTILIFIYLLKTSRLNAQKLNDITIRSPTNMRDQLFNDLSLVKNNINMLQEDMEQFNGRLNSQAKIIRQLQVQFTLSDNAVDKCEMAEKFYDIDIKIVKIKQKIQQVINDNDDQHMDRLDQIMHNVRKTTLECSMDGQDLFVAFQTNITAKLNKFNGQIERLEALENRLLDSEKRENTLKNTNNSLTVLLNEIQNKLIIHEEKLKNLESYLPLMVNATQSLLSFKKDGDALCGKQKCISKKIVELTEAHEVEENA